MSRSSRLALSSWIVLLVVLLAGTFLYLTRDNGYTTVRIVPVERAALVSNLTTNGKVEPVESVSCGEP